jgi:hypothetical protein
MGNLWLKFKIWAKILLFAGIAMYTLTFVAKNSAEKAKLWLWFYRTPTETSVLIFGLSSFLVGVVVTLLVRTTFATVRQIREVRDRSRSEKLAREVADMQAKAATLKTRTADEPPSNP